MINSSYTNRLMEMFPEEFRLIHQAKSGDANAFIELYDVCVERVYRYIYFLAPNTRIAEVLTLQVFFKAWEHLDRYQIFGSSFVVWLYSVARDQTIAYYHTHKKTVAPDNDFTLAVRGGDFRKEFQSIRDGLGFLTGEQQQVLILKFIASMPIKNIARVEKTREGDVRVLQLHSLQVLTEHLKGTELRIDDLKGMQQILEECLMSLSNGVSSLDECLALYPEYAAQLRPLLETALLLNLGRDVEPLSTFTAYTRSAVNQYMQSHPRQRQIVVPMLRRNALAFAMLVAVLLATGTAQAQSALPGDTFYAWKRTSEQAWRALSSDPVAADIILAERRLNEWIAVSDDSMRSTGAKFSYLEALDRLKNDEEDFTRIVPALQSQNQTLNDAGLASSELSNYLVAVAADGLSASVPTQGVLTNAVSTAAPASASTHIAPIETEVPTEIAPAETEVPTEIVPIETVVPTEIVPAETEVPTEIVPVETEVPTEIVPVETEVPTEIVPAETEVSTEIAPAETEVPVIAETAPIETEAPAPTEIVPPAAPTPPTEAAPTEQIP